MSEWRRIARFNEELHGWMRDVLSALHVHVVLGYQKSTSDGIACFPLGREESPGRMPSNLVIARRVLDAWQVHCGLVLSSTLSAPCRVFSADLLTAFFVPCFTLCPAFFVVFLVAWPVSRAASLVALPASFMSCFGLCVSCAMAMPPSSPSSKEAVRVLLRKFMEDP